MRVAPRKEPAERMRVFARCKNNKPKKEIARMYKYVLTAALIVGCTLPAFAAKGSTSFAARTKNAWS